MELEFKKSERPTDRHPHVYELSCGDHTLYFGASDDMLIRPGVVEIPALRDVKSEEEAWLYVRSYFVNHKTLQPAIITTDGIAWNTTIPRFSRQPNKLSMVDFLLCGGKWVELEFR